jgi:hypothetical protein
MVDRHDDTHGATRGAGREEFLTPEEAAEWSKRIVAQRDTDRRREGIADVTAAYNNAWYDYGTKAVATRRTSLIVGPGDGRVPPLTPDGQKRAAAAVPGSGFQDGRKHASWLDRGLWERCITRGVPDVMLPTAYNNCAPNFTSRPSRICVGVRRRVIRAHRNAGEILKRRAHQELPRQRGRSPSTRPTIL